MCFEYKIVSVDFFFKMQPLDIDMIADHVQYTDRPVWDCTRILSLYMIAPYSKKRQKIQDLFPLPWDEEAMSDQTEEDFKAHVARMDELAKML